MTEEVRCSFTIHPSVQFISNILFSLSLFSSCFRCCPFFLPRLFLLFLTFPLLLHFRILRLLLRSASFNFCSPPSSFSFLSSRSRFPFSSSLSSSFPSSLSSCSFPLRHTETIKRQELPHSISPFFSIKIY